jgi:tetratricopeptide (TPR) repeat protein
MVSPQQPPELIRATGHFNLAQQLVADTAFDQAIGELNKAIALVPQMHDYRSLRGRCHYRIGNYAEAFEDLNRAISLNPDGVWQSSDLYHRGACFLSTQKYPEAIADFTKAISQIDAEVNEIKAYYKAQGFDDEPMGEWQKRLYAYAHWRRADAHEQTGNQSQAKLDRKAAAKFAYPSTGEPESERWWSDDEE